MASTSSPAARRMRAVQSFQSAAECIGPVAMDDCDVRDEITPYRTLDQVMYGWSHRA